MAVPFPILRSRPDLDHDKDVGVMDTFYLSSVPVLFRALEVGRKNASMCGCDTAASGKRASPLAVLDVVVLAPDMTSFTYFAKWNEKGLDHDKNVGFVDTFDLSSVAGKFRVSLRHILQEVDVVL